MTFRLTKSIAVLVLAIALSANGHAEELKLGQDVFDQQIVLMQQGKWDEALNLHQQIINEHGDKALENWGSLFGSIYYRKGLCELKLQKWDAAMESFKTCHEKFPNVAGAHNENPYVNMSLLRWAEAAMRKEQWRLALDLMAQFGLKYEPQRDRFHPGKFLLNQSTCHFKLGDLEKGIATFQHVLDNR